MKKLTLLSTCAILALGTAIVVNAPVMAGEDSKVEHYDSQEFSNKADALKALLATSNEMASIAADAKLDATKIEKIHQISYTTENAVAKLGAGKKLAAALEEVHLASEEHDVADLKNKFIVYQAELNSYIVKK